MRIISQDTFEVGYVDLPYEQVTLRIEKYTKTEEYGVFAYINNQRGAVYEVARYSSREKAQRAMDMLRRTCLESMQEEIYHGNVCHYGAYFQFPKDEEVVI